MLKLWSRSLAHRAIGIAGTTAALALSVACSDAPDVQPAEATEANDDLLPRAGSGSTLGCAAACGAIAAAARRASISACIAADILVK